MGKRDAGAAAYRDGKPPMNDLPRVSGGYDANQEATLITPPNGRPTPGGYSGYGGGRR